tara:strand:+ start:1818 stop:2366 length:549 start_codon:yes stop_codon:yes gene_type:complete
MISFNILYTDYKDQQLYRRSVKCDINNDATYNIKYTHKHMGNNRSSSVEISFCIGDHIVKYIDEYNNINYKVQLLPNKDAAIYSNASNLYVKTVKPNTKTKYNDNKLEEILNYISTMLFISIPKDSVSPGNLKILVDYRQLDELIEKYDYEVLTLFMININIYDKRGIFHMIQKYENTNIIS